MGVAAAPLAFRDHRGERTARASRALLLLVLLRLAHEVTPLGAVVADAVDTPTGPRLDDFCERFGRLAVEDVGRPDDEPAVPDQVERRPKAALMS